MKHQKLYIKSNTYHGRTHFYFDQGCPVGQCSSRGALPESCTREKREKREKRERKKGEREKEKL